MLAKVLAVSMAHDEEVVCEADLAERRNLQGLEAILAGSGHIGLALGTVCEKVAFPDTSFLAISW